MCSALQQWIGLERNTEGGSVVVEVANEMISEDLN
jgi:hypothetical protein